MKNLKSLQTDERFDKGYVIILPGIEGRSRFNKNVAWGLAAAGVPFGIEIHDWTWRICKCPMLLYNLRSRGLHERQAATIASKISTYQQKWPNRPVYLIGHSGGAALTVETLERMPLSSSISGAILLGSALSPGYSLKQALRHVDRKIWSFSSWGDCLFLGLITTLAGTVDGRHSPSAGMLGSSEQDLTREDQERFEACPYRRAYFRDWNFGGHFGFTARPFVQRHIAPLLLSCPTSAEAISDAVCENIGLRIASTGLLRSSPNPSLSERIDVASDS
ncbi:hypothetical protein [Planctomicrobium sp. SH527]|uniref:hypothetical protein n=1 Tax=Planctomicrobium sp. SH527 TaxID=3448123 RepID=UPI003F5CA935